MPARPTEDSDIIAADAPPARPCPARRRSRRPRDPDHRRHRRARPPACAGLRARGRHRGAARARRAQARSALRRDRRGGTAAADDPAARPRHRRRRRLRQRRRRHPRATGPARRRRPHGQRAGLAGAARAPGVRRVAQGAARRPDRGDGADPRGHAAARRRRRRERRVHARHPRRGAARLLGRLCGGQGGAVGAGNHPGRRMGEPAQPARQRRRAGADQLAAARARRTPARIAARGPIRPRWRRSTCTCSPASRRPKAGC